MMFYLNSWILSHLKCNLAKFDVYEMKLVITIILGIKKSPILQMMYFDKCLIFENFTIWPLISNHISKFRQNRNKNGITRWCTGYDQLLGGDETDVFDRRK